MKRPVGRHEMPPEVKVARKMTALQCSSSLNSGGRASVKTRRWSHSREPRTTGGELGTVYGAREWTTATCMYVRASKEARFGRSSPHPRCKLCCPVTPNPSSEETLGGICSTGLQPVHAVGPRVIATRRRPPQPGAQPGGERCPSIVTSPRVYTRLHVSHPATQTVC